MIHRPYQGINKSKPTRQQFIISTILIILIFFGLLFLLKIIEPRTEQFNIRAPTLERTEKAAMSPHKP